ncbi:hypothetical protein M569_01556 [Genlisea aurea]|uniref:Uncharacterized protein n=1 Tax=Genlisea aurea TaxID=192259 RepID=S8D6X3_9LAMI|nr:hypothetical protein M569_01556 [Genlisea aurea]
MPLKRVIADVLGVATISLVALLVLLGLFCVVYSLYFQKRIRRQGLFQLEYFSGPWIVRIVYICFAVWWGFGEIIRLSLLRRHGRVLDSLSLRAQENLCKCYIVSNLGFAEPCLCLTLIFLLRASVQSSLMFTRNWNWKTARSILMFCVPMLVLQLLVILVGPKYKKELNPKLASYFVEAASTTTTTTSEMQEDDNVVALCTYPLFSTILVGVFATGLTAYTLWLGRKVLHLVINKGLQKRVCTLMFSVSSFLPLRVLLLGLSVLSDPERLPFDVISFLAFLSLLFCVGIGICILVYLPIADSLSLRSLQRFAAAGESRRTYGDTLSLIANQGTLDESMTNSPSMASVAARGSISFRTTTEKDELVPESTFVELKLFNSSDEAPPPCLLGWPMIPLARGRGL